MEFMERGLKQMTLGGLGIAAAVCLLPLIIGTASLSLAGAFLAPLELGALTAAVGGLVGLGWLRLRSRVGSGSGEEGSSRDGSPSSLACDMGALDPNARETHARNAEEVLSSAEEIRETSEGYAFRLAPDPDLLGRAARFMAHERVCCPFFGFSLTVDRDGGRAWLSLGGSPEIKKYLRMDLVARVRAARPNLGPPDEER